MRIRRAIQGLCAAGPAAALLLVPGGAEANSHRWEILRAFSNADGSVQFINLFVSDPAATEEHEVGDVPLDSLANTFVFPHDLPLGKSTYQTWMLVATPDYAALPGAVEPDYVMPAQFFDPTGDFLQYIFSGFPIPAGEMPRDGSRMLQLDGSTPLNVATNFAGESGSVHAPSPISAVPRGHAVLLLLAVASIGIAALARRSRQAGPP